MTERSPLAVVTGAASGIGLAAAELLLERGHDIVGVDLAEAPAALSGARASWVAGDVASAATWAAVGEAVAAGGRSAADAYVASAGTLVTGPMLELSVEDWQRVFDVNVFGVLRGIHALAPGMRARGRGAIAVVASVNSVVVEDTLSPYCASKAALLQVVRSAALEYAADGLRVNAVLPGVVDTPMLRRFIDVLDDPGAVVHSLEQRIPTGHLIQPLEIAEVLCFLVSDRASALSGAALMADGGLTTSYAFNVDGRSGAATAPPPPGDGQTT